MAALLTPEFLGAVASLLVIVIGFLFKVNRKQKTDLEATKEILDRADNAMRVALKNARERKFGSLEHILDRQSRDIRTMRHILSKKD